MMLTYNEDDMLNRLSELLFAGERIEAALYCMYHQTGFFATGHTGTPGYVAVTDQNRLIGCKFGLIGSAAICLDMECLKKIKSTKMLLNQRIIHMVFNDGKKRELKFQISPMVVGSGFPEQERNFEAILNILRIKYEQLQ